MAVGDSDQKLPDDDFPVDEGWLISVGFTKHNGYLDIRTETIALGIGESMDGKAWICPSDQITYVTAETRRDVRQLLKSLEVLDVTHEPTIEVAMVLEIIQKHQELLMGESGDEWRDLWRVVGVLQCVALDVRSADESSDNYRRSKVAKQELSSREPWDRKVRNGDVQFG